MDKQAVTLKWFSTVNKIGQISGSALGMEFEMYDVAVFDDALIFGGEVSVDIPVFNSDDDKIVEIIAEQIKFA